MLKLITTAAITGAAPDNKMISPRLASYGCFAVFIGTPLEGETNLIAAAQGQMLTVGNDG